LNPEKTSKKKLPEDNHKVKRRKNFTKGHAVEQCEKEGAEEKFVRVFLFDFFCPFDQVEHLFADWLIRSEFVPVK